MAKVGRPRKDSERQTQQYQRIAIKPETYAMIVRKSTKAKTTLIDWLDGVVKKA